MSYQREIERAQAGSIWKELCSRPFRSFGWSCKKVEKASQLRRASPLPFIGRRSLKAGRHPTLFPCPLLE